MYLKQRKASSIHHLGSSTSAMSRRCSSSRSSRNRSRSRSSSSCSCSSCSSSNSSSSNSSSNSSSSVAIKHVTCLTGSVSGISFGPVFPRFGSCSVRLNRGRLFDSRFGSTAFLHTVPKRNSGILNGMCFWVPATLSVCCDRQPIVPGDVLVVVSGAATIWGSKFHQKSMD